jgi:cyclophilin family peptidyl-prolyl cis-trans isomerase/HEAT repeat protein
VATIITMIAMAGVACDDDEGEGSATAAPSSEADGGAPDPDARVKELLEAELRRNLAGVNDEDLSSRDVRVRRAAARALARMRDAKARRALTRLVHDEDEIVVAWAAYGLGDVCAGAREATVQLLATVAASRQATTPKEVGKLSAQRSIARAVAKCGTPDAEQVLASWALRRDASALDAIHGLGVIARANKRLREESYVALLKLAEGDASDKPMPAAFYPLGKAQHLRTPSVIERTRKLAEAALEHAGPERVYAVSALGRCDEGAVPALARVLSEDGFTPHERVVAARNLARFGRDGQDALAAGLEELARGDVGQLVKRTHTLVTVLEQLTIFRKARATLKKLSELAAPDGADQPTLRRLSWIRCSAAKHVAERDYKNEVLRSCDLLADDDERDADPLESSIGARAIVAAIGVDAAKIRGARLAAWRAYALGGDLRARESALRLIGSHGEIAEAPAALTAALESTEPGLVATAAEIISKHPNRAQADGVAHPSISDALLARLDGKGPSADLEVLGAVIEAVGKLELEKGKALLIEHCRSPYAVIRVRAQSALKAIMGKDSPKCSHGEPLEAPVELARVPSGPVTIALDSDVGKLTLKLDPELAPIATTRAIDLAKNGFYDGMVVHRVVPGFVSQFGSPTADGYGGVMGLPSIPCETSPVPYGPLSVGVALAGRDTGSSQLFVTHASVPHLDGDYALIGTAEGPWDELVDGDVIKKATVAQD